jgi:hypothetical protein
VKSDVIVKNGATMYLYIHEHYIGIYMHIRVYKCIYMHIDTVQSGAVKNIITIYVYIYIYTYTCIRLYVRIYT